MTPDEKRKKKLAVQTFTPEEIGILWRACRNEWEQALLIMGLNFASNQTQLSELKKSDCMEDHLHLFRAKTGVEVYYDYWPETRRLVEHWVATTPKNDDNRLFITANGHALVHYSEAGNKTDNARQAWERIMKRSGLPEERRLTFSALRDTASNVMLKRGGPLVQGQVLAHAPTTIAGRHYTQQRERSDFAEMNRHLMNWWDEEIGPAITSSSSSSSSSSRASTP
jgi:integrase